MCIRDRDRTEYKKGLGYYFALWCAHTTKSMRHCLNTTIPSQKTRQRESEYPRRYLRSSDSHVFTAHTAYANGIAGPVGGCAGGLVRGLAGRQAGRQAGCILLLLCSTAVGFEPAQPQSRKIGATPMVN